MPQTISMLMLGVANADASVEFYRDIAGFDLLHRFEGFAFFNAGPITLVLSESLGRAFATKNGALEVILPADSVKDAHAALAAKGVVFRKPPNEVTPGQWAANFDDPDGHILTLFGPP